MRKIGVVTGSRAEYGLLYHLLKECQADPALDLQLFVTGMHLSPEFGLTYREIEQDGFRIDAAVEMLLSSDTPVGIAKSMGLGVIGFAEAFSRHKPDILVLLGDRYEILAAAQAAMVARIPIAHIHGGETTEGAIDEGIRHALTKLSHLHFVSAEPYRRRVIQLGEHPDRVFTVGAPGLDHIRSVALMSRGELAASLGFNLGAHFFLVTYHPVTLNSDGPEPAMNALLNALDAFPDYQVVFTKPNSDTDGRHISQIIDAYGADRRERVLVATSLGHRRYLSAMAHATAVVGNSSSGLLEAPSLKTATVNIGPRQQGRLRALSVLDAAETTDSIVTAITQALSADFRASLEHVESPYDHGGASRRIKETIAGAALSGLLIKHFYDLPRGNA